ncbi:MAG: 50S ribosomal protein L21 [Nitrospirota bacterium]|nr:50S ribosomal protein L21 [Nitrospirota bacterium]
MFAIIESGSKQHRVAPGDVLALEKLVAEPGDKVSFDRVLLVTQGEKTSIGQPTVAGAVVSATVLEQTRGQKIVVFKKKRRKKYRRKQGHRQYLTRVRIDDIKVG